VAELDRLHPERVAFRPTTVDGLREALRQWDERWRPTVVRTVALGEDARRVSTNDHSPFTRVQRNRPATVGAEVSGPVPTSPTCSNAPGTGSKS
jgi:hypothetical protein